MDFKQYLREQDEPTDDDLKQASIEAGTDLGDDDDLFGDGNPKPKKKKKTIGDRVKAAAKAAKDVAGDEDVQKGAKKLKHKRGVGVQGSWGDNPQVQFKTMGKQGRGAEEEEEEEANEWKAPSGEPILFERSKRGLERIIGSSRTSQLQKNKARKDLQKKRKEQIKRADKTADNPKTDLNTAIRAADASIDAKKKVKKFKAPPEKTKVKTDFGPPEKAFKD
jgi:hypothetical protein